MWDLTAYQPKKKKKKKKKDVDLTSFCLLLGFYMNHAFGLVGITTFYCMRSCLIDYNVEDPL